MSRQADEAEPTVALGGGRPGIPALYRVTRELGRGGMGIVYEASHQVLRRRVALKVPAPEIQNCAVARERFLSEARIAAGLRHPNIVTIYDAGECDGGLYIAMALIEGITLEEHLARRGPLPPGELLPLARQICAGLAHAHAHTIVHADVKPANILLDSAGTVHLTDFGLARAWDGTDGVTAEARGTPSYIAPEQVRGEALDPRTDIYSLGCTLYRLLVGVPPFAKGNILYSHLYEEPPGLRERNPDIPEALEAVILRCLAKRPAERFASMTHLLDALEEALSSAPTVPVPAAEVDTVTALTP
jgi:serine/threonine-protein kinase